MQWRQIEVSGNTRNSTVLATGFKRLIPLCLLLPTLASAVTVPLDFSPSFNAKVTRNSADEACNF